MIKNVDIKYFRVRVKVIAFPKNKQNKSKRERFNKQFTNAFTGIIFSFCLTSQIDDENVIAKVYANKDNR